ncbi:hypothetical protein BgiBS90_019325, partial [Biomphalaria glabrata]
MIVLIYQTYFLALCLLISLRYYCVSMDSIFCQTTEEGNAAILKIYFNNNDTISEMVISLDNIQASQCIIHSNKCKQTSLKSNATLSKKNTTFSEISVEVQNATRQSTQDNKGHWKIGHLLNNTRGFSKSCNFSYF